MQLHVFIYKSLSRLFHIQDSIYSDDYVQYRDKEANDLIFDLLASGKPCMIAKYGTVELTTYVSYKYGYKWTNFKDFVKSIKGLYTINYPGVLKVLCNNAGFFPYDVELGKRFCDLVEEDTKQLDILCSYQTKEQFIPIPKSCVRVNLEGYYAPFLWEQPWTRVLKGKKVLVVHPFVDSIAAQYENNREKLFEDKEVLPEFSKISYVKAIQSIADNKDLPFKDWFEALKFMEDEIDKCDYDIALIGCGAYGFNLAAHCKQKGKQAVHLAGWTQMLFGVYGERWIKDQPKYNKFINEYWTRPSVSEKPAGANKVENGCYW